MKKTLLYVAEAVSEKYNIDINRAAEIVKNSFFPEMLDKIPEYVQHYDAEYWADEIMENIMAR